jgi:pimeloyl-ACP methyl ester carboxylesterase
MMLHRAPGADPAVEFATIAWNGGEARIEYERIAGRAGAPLVVFLHEGLGSRSMWRNFPRELCELAQCRGLVFSRPGYGRSSPEGRRGVDYLHRQSYEALPAFLEAVGAGEESPWLFGHSDGGTIALLYAARFPEAVSGIVVVAPHIFVEDVTVLGLERARTAFLAGGQREKLARHHDDPDTAFWSWNDVWLLPRFREWNIERELRDIRCPILAVQGVADEYATLEQIRGIARHAPQTRLLELEASGHAPHRDQPEKLMAAVADFIAHAR